MTRFRGRINRIVSTLETINGAIKSGRLEGLNRIEPPKWTASIHELVFIRAETIDPVADRVKTSDEFNLRLRKLNEFCDDLKTRYQLDFKKAHEQNKIKFTRMAEQRAQMKIDCDSLTQRNFLSRMFSNFYRSSEGARMAFLKKCRRPACYRLAIKAGLCARRANASTKGCTMCLCTLSTRARKSCSSLRKGAQGDRFLPVVHGPAE